MTFLTFLMAKQPSHRVKVKVEIPLSIYQQVKLSKLFKIYMLLYPPTQTVLHDYRNSAE